MNQTVKVIALFFLFVTSFHVNAQREWSYGINGGVNITSVDFMPRIKTKSMLTQTMGATLRYISEKNLGLQGELNYAQQGFTQDFMEQDTLYSYTRNINYIEIPLLTHIYFGGQKTRGIINIGPKIAYQISSKEKMNTQLETLVASGNQTSFSVYEHYNKAIDKRVDYGLLVGMGMEQHTPLGVFNIEGRYYLGLGDIFNNSRKDTFSRSANRVISLKITYLLSYKKR